MDAKEIQISLPWGIICGKAWGDPNNIPVLMVHGIQDNSGSFDNLIPLLPKQGFYYVCIDLPGHGKSSHFPQGFYFGFINYIESVRRIIDGLKWEKCIFVGHSLGGHIGIYFTSAFPEIVIKLVVIDSLFSNVIPTEKIHSVLGETINAQLNFETRLSSRTAPDYTYDEAVQRLITNRPVPITKEGAKILVKRCLVKSNHGFRYSLDPRLKLPVGNYFSFEQQKCFIDNIKQPIIVILAYDSIELPVCENIKKTNTALFKDLKHCITKMVEGNHNVHMDYPERVAPLISAFLQWENSHL